MDWAKTTARWVKILDLVCIILEVWCYLRPLSRRVWRKQDYACSWSVTVRWVSRKLLAQTTRLFVQHPFQANRNNISLITGPLGVEYTGERLMPLIIFRISYEESAAIFWHPHRFSWGACGNSDWKIIKLNLTVSRYFARSGYNWCPVCSLSDLNNRGWSLWPADGDRGRFARSPRGCRRDAGLHHPE